jgi:hypothetical protein
MSTYWQQGWSGRVSQLGDRAETTFLSTVDCAAEKFGLDRTHVNLAAVPAFVRYTPDFLCHNGLVECMGIGRDKVLKLKVEKLDALCQWDKQFFTYLFVFDSAANLWTEQPIEEVRHQCHTTATMQRFPEGKPAWFLDLRSLNWEWTAATAAEQDTSLMDAVSTAEGRTHGSAA